MISTIKRSFLQIDPFDNFKIIFLNNNFILTITATIFLLPDSTKLFHDIIQKQLSSYYIFFQNADQIGNPFLKKKTILENTINNLYEEIQLELFISITKFHKIMEKNQKLIKIALDILYVFKKEAYFRVLHLEIETINSYSHNLFHY
jgi:superfamily I DNA and/or RNA helicase